MNILKYALALALCLNYHAEAQPKLCMSKDWLYGMGAVLLGAAAGAGCGYAAGQSGKGGGHKRCHCPTPPIPPEPPVPADCACQDCLCTATNCDLTFTFEPFDMSLGVIPTSGGMVSLTGQFFATTPLGCTILGTQFNGNNVAFGGDALLFSVLSGGTVDVTSACCGTYQVGFSVDFESTRIMFTSLSVFLAGVRVTSNCGIGQSIVVPGGLSPQFPNFSDTIPNLSSYISEVAFPFSFQPAECQVAPAPG